MGCDVDDRHLAFTSTAHRPYAKVLVAGAATGAIDTDATASTKDNNFGRDEAAASSDGTDTRNNQS